MGPSTYVRGTSRIAQPKIRLSAIENERDEDVVVDTVEGGLPQLPAGFLVIVDIKDKDPENWTLRKVDLTGLSDYAPSDPEPEFVDINKRNQAVVTLQENNHVVVVDLLRGEVVNDFGLGAVTLVGVDATEDDNISLIETLEDVKREPDAVTWLPRRSGHGKGDDDDDRRRGIRRADLIATANEGDLFGGSRGFSIFDVEGKVLFDSGASFEELAVRHGHYPENRSENKGSEPEAIEYGRFRGEDYLFVGSERGSFVAVYEMKDAKPEFVQVLPGPLGPEGLLAIPKRDLLVVAGEVDDPIYGVRSSIMIYKLTEKSPTYPQILSANKDGSPIPWSAQQRGWDYTTSKCEELDDDPGGANSGEPTQTRVWIYDPADASWDHFSYELEPVPENASWVGLSEITRIGKDGSYVFIERDNLTGDFATLKTLVKVDESALEDGIVSHSEKTVYDLIPELEASNGWITDKPEGVAVTDKGQVFLITDNDGVDDWSGETWFLGLGHIRNLFDVRDEEDDDDD